MKRTLLLFLLTLYGSFIFAQSPTYINTTFNINAGVPITWYGDVTFGPNAVVYIEDGGLGIFYGKNMVVDPGATFIALPGNNQIGTGTIIFKENNPMFAGYPLQQTLNGGFTSGNNPSMLNIEIDNANGVSLTGNTRVTNQIVFTKGHIYLNNFDLILGAGASLNNYDVNKHVVTNGTGVLTKQAINTGADFIFPVSIAGTDYTPAIVTNVIANRNISVQVKDYATSASIETTFVNKGMERTWQITSNLPGAANVTLQHNAGTNTNGVGTNESGFNNVYAFVSQQMTPGSWTQSCTGLDGGMPISINTGNNFNLPVTADATAFFTKKTVVCTDLMVAKTVDNLTPIVGGTVTFTIVARNFGVVDATGVVVTDQLPSGYTYVSSTVTAGAYNNVTGLWTIGNLANGASATLRVTAIVNPTGNYINIARITGNETDPVIDNNEETAAPIPGVIQANLGVVKTANNMAPTTGNNVVFTNVASNVGPNNATNVKVTDLLSAGYTFISSTVTTGTYDNVTGTWTIGNFANGASATMTITARVNAVGPFGNTATIAGAELDPVPANNTSTITLSPNAALVDLSILKSTVNIPTSMGDEYTYNLEVTNKGVNLASELLVTDILAAGLQYISSNTTNGTVNYNPSTRTLTWSIAQLAVGAKVTLTLKVKTDVPGLVKNTASVTSKEQDSNPADNSSTVDKEIFDLRMPNVITPDGDGKNDVLKIPGLKVYPENTMSVFNRWGNEVWNSNGVYQENWDGKGLNEGTYYFKLSIKDKTGKWQTFIRWVQLLKD